MSSVNEPTVPDHRDKTEHAQLVALADTMPALMWVSDANAERIFFNTSWLKFVSRPLEQQLGKGWLEGVQPEDFDRCLESYLSAVKAREPFTVEYRLRRHDGEFRWMLDSGSPWFKQDGEFGGFVGSCIDLTEHKQLEEDLRNRVFERSEELARAYKEVESFSYSVSHDLRSPLRSIVSNLTFLIEDFGDEIKPEAREYIDRVKLAASRMENLMQGILKLSRLTRKQAVFGEVDLSAIAEGIFKDKQAEGEERTYDVQPGLVAYGDAELLEAVLENLVSNAFKFKATRVEFGHNGEAYFVRDNGVGFDPQYSSKLFQPFERLHSPTEYPGTGIGLATVKRIIERHAGKVSAEGAEGAGATFYFTLDKQP